jgi:DNA-binding PadR family transcriptional regulator
MQRIMARRPAARSELSLLEGALLGLLHGTPQSGYALRRIFQETPMLHFSDSPGSIYPALRRLARRGAIRGTVEGGRTLRPRQVFRLTPAGTAALHAWLSAPVTRDTVVHGLNGAMLRFAFLDGVLGAEATAAFLEALTRELAAEVASLDRYIVTNARSFSLTARLALGNGRESYAAHLRWARRAARRFRAHAAARPGGRS